MSSRQEQRVAASAEGKAQAQRAGEQRAREIAHERTERARLVGAGAGGHEERRRVGILESVQQGARSLVSAVGRTLGVASRDTTTKDCSVDKASQAGDATAHKEKASETAGAAKDKLGEYKDYAAGEATEAKDAVAQKASEAAEATKGKVGEYKDYAADKTAAAAQKANEAAEATKGKLGEYKDYAADKASEMKDAAAHKAGGTAEATKVKAVEMKDAAVQKASETAEATKDKAAAMKEAAADKARETKEAGASKAKQSTEELSKAARGDKTMEETKRSPEEKLEESAADAARNAMEYLILRTEEEEVTGASKVKARTDATEEVEAAAREQVAEAERRSNSKDGNGM